MRLVWTRQIKRKLVVGWLAGCKKKKKHRALRRQPKDDIDRVSGAASQSEDGNGETLSNGVLAF